MHSLMYVCVCACVLVHALKILHIFCSSGCKFHLDCHLSRNFEVETFLNMVSVAGLHKQGYTFLNGKIIK